MWRYQRGKARKGLIKGVLKTFTLVHKMPRYLLIYYKIYFGKRLKWKLIFYHFVTPTICILCE